MENNADSGYGTVTVGAGTPQARKLNILDFVQAEYADHRLISIAGIEEDSVIVSVENPGSTGRAANNTMWLSRESLLGVVASALIYFSAKGENLVALAEASAKNNQINYSYSDNLGPATLE